MPPNPPPQDTKEAGCVCQTLDRALSGGEDDARVGRERPQWSSMAPELLNKYTEPACTRQWDGSLSHSCLTPGRKVNGIRGWALAGHDQSCFGVKPGVPCHPGLRRSTPGGAVCESEYAPEYVGLWS